MNPTYETWFTDSTPSDWKPSPYGSEEDIQEKTQEESFENCLEELLDNPLVKQKDFDQVVYYLKLMTITNNYISNRLLALVEKLFGIERFPVGFNMRAETISFNDLEKMKCIPESFTSYLKRRYDHLRSMYEYSFKQIHTHGYLIVFVYVKGTLCIAETYIEKEELE